MDLLANDKSIMRSCASITKKRLEFNNDLRKINGILPDEINIELIDLSTELDNIHPLVEGSSNEENSDDSDGYNFKISKFIIISDKTK
jgi:hypothetical protein